VLSQQPNCSAVNNPIGKPLIKFRFNDKKLYLLIANKPAYANYDGSVDKTFRLMSKCYGWA